MKTYWASALIALSLCMTAPQASAAGPERLVIGADLDAGTLDPRLTNDITAYRVADLLYSGLVHIKPDFTAVPDLAESWSTPDATIYIFTLREDLTFSDGTPLTADDVVYTYQSIVDPALNSMRRSYYSPIETVEALDTRTVRFTLSEPYAPLLSYLDLGIVCRCSAGQDLTEHPLGAGPMVLTDRTPGQSMYFSPNPRYWGQKPDVSELGVHIYSDISVEAEAFENGRLDAIQSPLAPFDITRLAANKDFSHVIGTGLGITYLNFNTSDPLLADPRMRAALSRFVDQQTIVEQIYEGVDTIATSVLLPSSWAYTPDIRQPGFDVAAGLEQLSALGWNDSDDDGVLDKDGKPLTLTLSTHSEDPNRVQALLLIQAVMQSAGVDARLRITDWRSFSDDYVQKSQHQIALLGWLNIVDPDKVLFSQLSSTGVQNWGKYSNAEVDALLQAGRASVALPDRAAAYRKAAGIIAQEVPYYVISAQGYQLFYQKKLDGRIVPDPRGRLRGLIGLED